MPIKTNEREYRNMTLRIEEEREEMTVNGYASTFNEPYELFRDGNYIVREQVDPNAFSDCDMSDVIMQYDHNGRVFARTSNNTLTVMPDNHGLLINANLGGTEIGRQLYEEIKGGYTNKMSFGFIVSGDQWTEEQDDDGNYIELRTITAVSKLFDVSAVSIPANDATSISVRGLSDGVIEKAKAERLKAQEEIERRDRLKKQLELKIKLMGVN